MALKDQKPNCAIAQANLRKFRIEEIKKIINTIGKKTSNADLYLMIAGKYDLSHRKASEYVRIAQFQIK